MKLRRTRVRRKTGRSLIEGPFLLEEAATAAITVHEVFARVGDVATRQVCETNAWPVRIVTADVMETLASSVSPRGPVAVIAVPATPSIEARDSVVLWGIADPGNAGTIIRTAGALGFQVIATAETVDLWSPKVIRAGVGGHFRTPPIEGLAADPSLLVAVGLTPLVAIAEAPTPVHEAVQVPDPVALIIGNEAHGVPADVLHAAGVGAFSIPMPGGSESLNASVAAGIAMYLRSLQPCI